MQRIERYGVIALVFLLVTVAAVSFWGEARDGKQSPEPDKLARQPESAPQTPQRPREGRNENAREANSPVPLNQRDGTDRERPRGEIVDLDPKPADVAPAPTLDEPALDAEPTNEDSASFDWPERIPGRSARDANGGARVPEEEAGLPPKPTTPANPPKSATPTSSGAAFVWHDVKPAETLSEIAQARLGKASRWREIVALNPGLTPETLRSGTRIKVPTVAGSAPSSSPEPRSDSGRVYVVKSGDTLSAIAARELGSRERIAEILALNPGLDPDVIVLGTSLRLPAGAAPPRSLAQAAPTPAAQQPRRETQRGARVR